MLTPLACIAVAVYFEARGENLAGQMMVAETILNRAEDPRWPSTALQAVLDPRWPSTACKVVKQRNQFSFYSDGKSDIPKNRELYLVATDVASEALEGKHLGSGSLWFHANYVKPSWRHRLEVSVRIGRHIFYKDKT